jgi:haloalkane dehalogenase
MNLSGQITPVITRHFIDCGTRRVHYRRCGPKDGSGPPLLMVHQSPRSSAEYEALMLTWGQHFTCIAPDSPGFGQSDPLTGAPEIDDFADALVAFLDALSIVRIAAYGFHSGGIILVTAMRRHPARFSCLAVGGYAIWTPQEMAIFGDSYLPPFVPSDYGEHLTWLWNRVLEQSWFFPWFDVRDDSRLSVAHDDPARVHATVMDMLDAGDAYRAGYGAVLRAPRDIPPPDAETPPVLITAYDGDPLQAHIDRLGEMPLNWDARKVATPAEHHADSLAFLQAHAAPAIGALPTVEDQGFAHIETEAFNGLIHWRGSHKASRMVVHAPGGEAATGRFLAIDLPGHGLSSDWVGDAPETIEPWRVLLGACMTHFGVKAIDGQGWSAALSDRAAPRPSPEIAERLIPDLTPDRFGGHLTRAWSVARATRLFDPWFVADAGHAIPVDSAALAPAALARDTRALLRARSGRALMIALSLGED